jgi:hypothetical protein
MKNNRQTHRSKSDKKLYALRDVKGRFMDIVEYKNKYSRYLKRKARKEDKSNERQQ